MHILVTGGLGFLGKNLIKRLIDEGHAVTSIDPASRGYANELHDLGVDPSRIKFRSPIHSPSQRGPAAGEVMLWWRHAELLKPWDIPACDRIYHLGAHASPPTYKARPMESLHAGSLATHALVDLAMRRGARLLLASTSEVYGDPHVSPQHEDYRGNVDPVGPRSMYDEAKRYAEAYLAAAGRSGAIDARIARIFNTFGPGMRLDDGRMIPAFIRSCVKGEPQEIHGSGKQTRTLCYVDDLIDGLVRLMEAPVDLTHDPDGCPRPINLGGRHEESVARIADEVRHRWHQVTGELCPDPRYVEQPCPQDPKFRRPSLGRAFTILGWEPTTPWEEGIERTIRWHVKKS